MKGYNKSRKTGLTRNNFGWLKGRKRRSRKQRQAARFLASKEFQGLETLEVRQLMSSSMFGDFNGDGFQDLAIGVPGEDVGTVIDAGGVNVIYGSPTGLTNANDDFWSQNSSGIRGLSEDGDRFGAAIAIGDFNGDAFDDLAIGVPWEDVGAIANAGSVNVIYGSITGLTNVGDDIWDQNRPGINGLAEADDRFGSALAAGDFNNDGKVDIAIAAEGGNPIFHGNGNGGFSLKRELSNKSSQDVAVGDFNNDGRDDVVFANIGSSSKIWICTVASSAVVGSSANNTRGLQASANAIIARWRMPPESSCGSALSRRSGEGICTRSNRLRARLRASGAPTFSWRRMVSVIWRPTV